MDKTSGLYFLCDLFADSFFVDNFFWYYLLNHFELLLDSFRRISKNYGYLTFLRQSKRSSVKYFVCCVHSKSVCCVFRPKNACLRMHSKTIKNIWKAWKSTFSIMRKRGSCQVYEEKWSMRSPVEIHKSASLSLCPGSLRYKFVVSWYAWCYSSSLQHNILRSFCGVLVLWNLYI